MVGMTKLTLYTGKPDSGGTWKMRLASESDSPLYVSEKDASKFLSIPNVGKSLESRVWRARETEGPYAEFSRHPIYLGEYVTGVDGIDTFVFLPYLLKRKTLRDESSRPIIIPSWVVIDRVSKGEAVSDFEDQFLSEYDAKRALFKLRIKSIPDVKSHSFEKDPHSSALVSAKDFIAILTSSPGKRTDTWDLLQGIKADRRFDFGIMVSLTELLFVGVMSKDEGQAILDSDATIMAHNKEVMIPASHIGLSRDRVKDFLSDKTNVSTLYALRKIREIQELMPRKDWDDLRRYVLLEDETLAFQK